MRPGRVMMFWDYDTQWGVDADHRRGLPAHADNGHLEFAHTERLLELHAEFGVSACFAVVGAAALAGARPYHDPAQIQAIHAAGHEIGSHSHRHDWIPGMSGEALLETLRRSREALEDCIGAPVTAFVPPYNQPVDHAPALSLSLSERRKVPSGRIDLGRLCGALRITGYGFCRVAYRPVVLRMADRIVGRRVDRPVRLEQIAGVTCCRLNTPGGFGPESLAMLERAARRGGIAVVYGHPHSLSAENPQNERFLIPLLERVRQLRAEGRLEVMLPRDAARAPVTL